MPTSGFIVRLYTCRPPLTLYLMWVRTWNFLDRWFFGPVSVGSGPLAVFVRVLRYPYAVVRDLLHGEINLRAMGLVYTTLLSLIPLLAFAFAILKAFGASRDLQPIVYEFFRPMGETGAQQLTLRVMDFVNGVSSGLVGSVGFALLLWTLVGTIKKVEDSFNFLWRVEHPRSFARRIAEYLGLLIAGPVLLVAFIGLAHATLGGTRDWIAGVPVLQGVSGVAINLAPYVMVTAFFTALYMFIPNTRVRLRPALIGAVTAGVIWAAVGKMFTALVVFSTRLTIIYAGFAFIVAALLWTYFGWLILLAGTQLSFYIQNPSYLRIGLKEMRLSSVELEQLALKLMYLVGRIHLDGGKLLTVNDLAAQLALPGIAIAQIANALERAGLMVVTDNDELTTGRDLGRITVQEILVVARNQRSGHFSARPLKLPAVDRLTAQLEEAWRGCCGHRSLRDLLDEPT
jgi:membrane protein